MSETRKIAAILVSDVVGYSRLAEADEERILARLRALRSDLMGDGVNIAARLEAICKPSAVCLSEDAYRQVKGRLDLVVSDLGLTQLKNIAEPVRVYSLEIGVPAQAKPSEPKRRLSP